MNELSELCVVAQLAKRVSTRKVFFDNQDEESLFKSQQVVHEDYIYYKLDSADLHKVFSMYGEVKEVSILKQPNQRIAFVRMANPFQAFCALRALNGTFIQEYQNIIKVRFVASDHLLSKLKQTHEDLKSPDSHDFKEAAAVFEREAQVVKSDFSNISMNNPKSSLTFKAYPGVKHYKIKKGQLEADENRAEVYKMFMSKHSGLVSKVFEGMENTLYAYQCVIFLQTDETPESQATEETKEDQHTVGVGKRPDIDDYHMYYNFPSQIIGTGGGYLHEIRETLLA